MFSLLRAADVINAMAFSLSPFRCSTSQKRKPLSLACCPLRCNKALFAFPFYYRQGAVCFGAQNTTSSSGPMAFACLSRDWLSSLPYRCQPGMACPHPPSHNTILHDLASSSTSRDLFGSNHGAICQDVTRRDSFHAEVCANMCTSNVIADFILQCSAHPAVPGAGSRIVSTDES